MRLKFIKMQATGNDFIYIDCLNKEPELDWKELAAKITRRHFAVGADGLILILPSKKADFKIRLFNSDGSEAEIDGNGIRGFAKYLYDKKITDKKVIKVETLCGITTIEITRTEKGKAIMLKANIGEPILEAEDIPVKDQGKIIDKELRLKNQCANVTCLSLGNPHCVIFLDSFRIPIEKIGPEIENHDYFPKRTNVEFVQVVNKEEINMQVWERGTGVTLASGTGAAAAVVASVLNKKTLRKVKVRLIGGDLNIEWNKEDNKVYIEGTAKEVFEGEYETG